MRTKLAGCSSRRDRSRSSEPDSRRHSLASRPSCPGLASARSGDRLERGLLGSCSVLLHGDRGRRRDFDDDLFQSHRDRVLGFRDLQPLARPGEPGRPFVGGHRVRRCARNEALAEQPVENHWLSRARYTRPSSTRREELQAAERVNPSGICSWLATPGLPLVDAVDGNRGQIRLHDWRESGEAQLSEGRTSLHERSGLQQREVQAASSGTSPPRCMRRSGRSRYMRLRSLGSTHRRV